MKCGYGPCDREATKFLFPIGDPHRWPRLNWKLVTCEPCYEHLKPICELRYRDTDPRSATVEMSEEEFMILVKLSKVMAS